MKKVSYIWFLLMLISFVGEGIKAQEVLQVVEMKYSSSFSYVKGMQLEIVGEKAQINIETHDKATIEFIVTVIAKHTDKKIAEEDINKMKFLKDKIAKKIYLRNYIEINNKESKPSSSLKVVYTIKVPIQCPIGITNYFGSIKVNGVTNLLDIKSEFSPIDIKEISGKIKIESTYGDIDCSAIDGEMIIQSNRSKIKLDQVKGSIDITAVLAEMELSLMDQLKYLNVNSERSDLIVYAENPEEFNYSLNFENVEWNRSEAMNFVILKEVDTKITAAFNSELELPKVIIQMETGSFSFKKLK